MKNIITWALRLITAGILLQTLRFKFLGDPLSVYIFTQVGAEPVGRYLTGILELIAGVLLLIPRHYHLGAWLAMALMFGAIGSHLTMLGIVVQNDGGSLIMLAVTVFVSSALILFLRGKKSS